MDYQFPNKFKHKKEKMEKCHTRAGCVRDAYVADDIVSVHRRMSDHTIWSEGRKCFTITSLPYVVLQSIAVLLKEQRTDNEILTDVNRSNRLRREGKKRNEKRNYY